MKTQYLEKVQFPVMVIHTPRILFEYFDRTTDDFPGLDDILPLHLVYYYFAICRTEVLGKFICHHEFNHLDKERKRAQLVEEQLTTGQQIIKDYFTVSKEEAAYFAKHFRMYQKRGDLAIKEKDANEYFKANEEFMFRMWLLIEKKHLDPTANDDLMDYCFGVEEVAMNDPPTDEDTEEYKSKYTKGLKLLQKYQKDCNATNAALAEQKLRSQLWTRTVFKEDELVEKMEQLKTE